MRPTFLIQGFLVILISSILLGGMELLIGDHSPLQFSAGGDQDEEIQPEDESGMEELVAELEEEHEEEEEADIPDYMRPPNPLARFFESLSSLRLHPTRTKVRIAYFGDSMIEGDLVTQTLRNDLQELFGGEGVGYVPTTSTLWGFRKTVRQRFDENQWFSYNVLEKKPSSFEYGISGELFLTKGWKPWLSFSGTEEYRRTRELKEARLFYGPVTEKASYCLVETATGKDTVWLTGTQLVNEVILSDSCGEDLDLKIVAGDKFPVYGASFGSTYGVGLDNFGMRNSTGSFLSKIGEESLRQFQQHLNYDLVVLQFGLNLVSADREDYSKYELALRKVVARFKVSMPGADILIVSVGDKCSRQGGKWKTDPSIPRIIEVQRRVADETGVGFLNLFEKMGGENAMVQWVNSDPSLARTDYAHPNRLGAEKVSAIVRDHLLEGYEEFSGESLGEKLALAQ
ncbi:MAG: GDSL-type esterase/lipase family protein [Bacteroidia bacterium]|nr:GDSL-type esterase/lipase family protein [Bacteroidia bacterium]